MIVDLCVKSIVSMVTRSTLERDVRSASAMTVQVGVLCTLFLHELNNVCTSIIFSIYNNVWVSIIFFLFPHFQLIAGLCAKFIVNMVTRSTLTRDVHCASAMILQVGVYYQRASVSFE